MSLWDVWRPVVRALWAMAMLLALAYFAIHDNAAMAVLAGTLVVVAEVRQLQDDVRGGKR